MKIILKVYDGNHYICAEGGGGGSIAVNRTEAHEWETFEVDGSLTFGGKIALRTYDGLHFLCAENGGGSSIIADRTEAHEWETFKIIGSGGKTDGSPVEHCDKISLQTYDGIHYLCAENGGGSTLVADRTEAHEWETFTAYIQETEASLLNISLKTFDSRHYICAENGGGSSLIANRTEAHEWETFEVNGSLKYGGKVSLRTYDGVHFLCADNGGGAGLIADRLEARTWETFRIIGHGGKTDGTPVGNGDKISLQTFDGSHYICAENGGGTSLIANRTAAQEWETFTVNITDSTMRRARINLQTNDGNLYVCAENGGGAGVVADRTDAQEWETFEVVGTLKYGGKISLKTYDGSHFLCAENGGGTSLVADRTNAMEWETFRIIGPNGKADGSAVENGDEISLQTSDGNHYVCAENGGGATVVANRTSAQVWETFTVNIKYYPAVLPTLRIIHISDLHCTSSDRTLDFQNGVVVEDFQNSEVKTSEISDYLINNKAQFGTNIIVMTGDLTDSGDESDYSDSKRGVLQFIQKVTSAGYTIFSVPGNHDYCFEGNQFSTTDELDRRNRFIIHITPQYAEAPKYPHIEDITDTNGKPIGRIILLDSMQEELDGSTGNSLAQGTLGDKQLYGDGSLKGLSDLVSEYQNDRMNGKKLIVALHHSPFSDSANGCLADRGKFRDIIFDKDKGISYIDCLLFGHTTPDGVYQQDFPDEEQQLNMPEDSINCENLEKMISSYPITLLDLTRHKKMIFMTDQSSWEPGTNCNGYATGCSADACGEKVGACIPQTCEAQAVGCAAEACGVYGVPACVADGCAAQATGCAVEACGADAAICAANACAADAGCAVDVCPVNASGCAAQACVGNACAVDVQESCAADGQVGPCAVDVPYCPFIL